MRVALPDGAEVDAVAAALLAVLHDEHGAAVAEQVDDLQPVLEVGVLLALIGNQQVERPFGEEELVGGVVYLLTTEVPNIDPDLAV